MNTSHSQHGYKGQVTGQVAGQSYRRATGLFPDGCVAASSTKNTATRRLLARSARPLPQAEAPSGFASLAGTPSGQQPTQPKEHSYAIDRKRAKRKEIYHPIR